jgi:hypothetical protein
MDFGLVFDRAFADALAEMLGGIPVHEPENDSLLPPHSNCVELGKTRIVGGIRPQNYDAAYRPDGPRVVYDGKTLNDRKSIGKNWQNMVNDLATEATTVHTRFPFCIVCFLVILPRPALQSNQERALIRTFRAVRFAWGRARSEPSGRGNLARYLGTGKTPIHGECRLPTLLGHSAFAPGMALPAPYLPFAIPIGIGSVGWWRSSALRVSSSITK